MADEQRSERGTPRRRQKARERGQVVRSRELPQALSLLGVAMFLRWMQGTWVPGWRTLLRNLLESSAHSDLSIWTPMIHWTAFETLRWGAPPLLLAWCVSALFLLAQGGLVIAPEALQPNFGRFNPASNVGRIFSIAGLSPLLKSVLPAGALLYLAVSILTREWPALRHAAGIGLRLQMSFLYATLYEFAWKGGLILFVWAGVDYGLQKWNYERSLRMSKQEIREEHKDSEGNPATRGRIKRKRYEAHRRLMLRRVRRATVVITNPEHFAVALEYLPEKMPAPVCVAKGRDKLAEIIKREARWHEIPIVENPALARALYRLVEVGETIPAKLYTAVAEVLAFIYRAQQSVRDEAARRAAAAGAGQRPAGAGAAAGKTSAGGPGGATSPGNADGAAPGAAGNSPEGSSRR